MDLWWEDIPSHLGVEVIWHSAALILYFQINKSKYGLASDITHPSILSGATSTSDCLQIKSYYLKNTCLESSKIPVLKVRQTSFLSSGLWDTPPWTAHAVLGSGGFFCFRFAFQKIALVTRVRLTWEVTCNSKWLAFHPKPKMFTNPRMMC